jgi:hypothetical protein
LVKNSVKRGSKERHKSRNCDLDAEGALAMITENVEAELKPIKFETWLSKSLKTSLATYCNNVIDSKRRRKGKII